MVASGGTTSPTGAGKQVKTMPHTKKAPSSPLVDSPATAAMVVVGSHHRQPDTHDPLLISIASKQAAVLVQQLITITCYIPSTTVGAVIGRRGSTIAQIQRQAQQVGTSNGAVRLSIVGHQNEMGSSPLLATTTTTPLALSSSGEGMQQQTPHSPDASLEQSPIHQQQQQQQQQLLLTPLQNSTASVPYTYSELDWSSPLWTPVVIRADPCAALTAAQLLRDKVGQLDDVIVDVPLGRNKHAAVVGRRGYVLANLSADTNVRIMVPRRELRHDVIQLEGELDKVKQCLERVLVVLSSDTTGSNNNNTKRSSNNKGNNSNNHNNSKGEKNNSEDAAAVVVIKLSVLPSQTKLRTIGRKTDTIIKRKKTDDNCWDVTITGSTQATAQSAVSILKKWSEDYISKEANNSNNNNGGNKDTPNNNNNTNNSSTPAKSRGGAKFRARSRRTGKEKRSRSKNNPDKNADSPAT